MVLKKLGPELRSEFLEVIDYLGRHEGMQVSLGLYRTVYVLQAAFLFVVAARSRKEALVPHSMMSRRPA